MNGAISIVHRRDIRILNDSDSLRDELFLQEVAHVRIFLGQQLWSLLEERDPNSKAVESLAKFAADIASANNGDAFRLFKHLVENGFVRVKARLGESFDVWNRRAGARSDDEVSGYMLALAAAGNETTRNAIAIGLHALLLRPEQMALLRAQGGMPESAVEEILRWASPAIHTVRLAKEDFTLHGETIRAGDRVALLLSSANFDPRQFERPEGFNVTRAANDHVAFGTSAHTCLGLHVARLELKILFEELLRRAPAIELAGKVEFIRDNLVHGIRKMPINFAGHG